MLYIMLLAWVQFYFCWEQNISTHFAHNVKIQKALSYSHPYLGLGSNTQPTIKKNLLTELLVHCVHRFSIQCDQTYYRQILYEMHVYGSCQMEKEEKKRAHEWTEFHCCRCRYVGLLFMLPYACISHDGWHRPHHHQPYHSHSTEKLFSHLHLRITSISHPNPVTITMALRSVKWMFGIEG